MKLNKKTGIGFKLIAGSLLLLASCSKNPDSAGLEYMPDMFRSPAIEPYVDYGEVREQQRPEFKNKRSAMVPPFGSIPYYGTNKDEVMLMLPYHRLPNSAFKLTHGLVNVEFTEANTYLEAAADGNALKLTNENQEQIFKAGKEIYQAQCAHCHGEKGDGNGPLMATGKFAGVPDYANLKQLSDGQMFYSIYYGKGSMGAHGATLNKKEIWTLVHYIRKMQNAGYGPESVVVPVADSIPAN